MRLPHVVGIADGAHVVLDRDWDAGERAKRFAGGPPAVDLLCQFESGVAVDTEEGVDALVVRADLIEVGGRDLDGGRVAALHRVDKLRDVLSGE